VPKIADRAERRRLFVQAWSHHITKLMERKKAAEKGSRLTPRPESVADEHAYVAQQRCDCGGSYEVAEEDRLKVGDEFFDTLRCRCVECGAEKGFSFEALALRDAEEDGA